jgi:hypothetical protein
VNTNIGYELLNDIRTDFIRANGEDGYTDVKTDIIGGEEVVIVENMSKRHYYSLRVQAPAKFELIRVENLRSEQ